MGGADFTPASVSTGSVRPHRRRRALPRSRSPRGRLPASGDRVRRMMARVAHPVPAAIAAAALLHLLWIALLANSGGDMAARADPGDLSPPAPDSSIKTPP